MSDTLAWTDDDRIYGSTTTTAIWLNIPVYDDDSVSYNIVGSVRLARLAAEAWVDQWLGEGEKLADRFAADSLAGIPDDLELAIKLLTGHWFNNREASRIGASVEEIPFGVMDIVNQYRAWSF